LFDEAETEVDAYALHIAETIELDEAEPALVKKAMPGRRSLPKALPRVRIEHDVPVSEKIC